MMGKSGTGFLLLIEVRDTQYIFFILEISNVAGPAIESLIQSTITFM